MNYRPRLPANTAAPLFFQKGRQSSWGPKQKGSRFGPGPVARRTQGKFPNMFRQCCDRHLLRNTSGNATAGQGSKQKPGLETKGLSPGPKQQGLGPQQKGPGLGPGHNFRHFCVFFGVCGASWTPKPLTSNFGAGPRQKTPSKVDFWSPTGVKGDPQIHPIRSSWLPGPLQEAILVENGDTHETSPGTVFWPLPPPWRAPFGPLLAPKGAQKVFQKGSQKTTRKRDPPKYQKAPKRLSKME